MLKVSVFFLKQRQDHPEPWYNSPVSAERESPWFNTPGCVISAPYPAVTQCVISLIQSWLMVCRNMFHDTCFSSLRFLKFISPYIIAWRRSSVFHLIQKPIDMISSDSLIFQQTNLSNSLFLALACLFYCRLYSAPYLILQLSLTLVR